MRMLSCAFRINELNFHSFIAFLVVIALAGLQQPQRTIGHPPHLFVAREGVPRADHRVAASRTGDRTAQSRVICQVPQHTAAALLH